jgi:hypothetical protein
MKHFEVTVQATATVYVAEAKDEQEAYSLAREAMSCGDFKDLEMTAAELTTERERDSSKRHADAWSAP